MNEAATSLPEQCAALRTGVGFCDLSGRSQIELTGADRAKVLHGLCTNDIKRLQPGGGCEAFLTNVQGKVTGYVNVFCGADSLLLDTSPNLAQTIIPALDRYVIREDVTFADRSQELGVLLVSGSKAVGWLSERFDEQLPTNRIGIAFGTMDGIETQVRRMPYASHDCYFVCFPTSSVERITTLLVDAGAVRCECEAIEIARIEMGVPIYGQDVTEDNLPQEIARDEHAISFTKGCYLGQETVARIDALGHVNRLLKGLKFTGDTAPPAGTVIEVDGKRVAQVTSSCHSQHLKKPFALTYVSRLKSKAGTTFETDFGTAEVVELPVLEV